MVTGLQLVLVDGRAYPLFGLLFGYGIGQLAARRRSAGTPVPEIVRLVRRRGLALVAIGAVHAALLWAGDIVAAYGLLAVAFAGVLVAGTAVSMATTAVVGGRARHVPRARSRGSRRPAPPRWGPSRPPTRSRRSVLRIGEWGGNVLLGSALSVLGAVALGAWAARHRLLEGLTEEPARHGRAFRIAASAGLAAAVVGGTPLALAAVGAWQPGTGALLAAGTAHTLGGYAGGLGYAAAFGLVAARAGAAPVRCPARSQRAGSARCRATSGSRCCSSRCCRLDLGLGARLGVAQAALLAVAVWLVLLGGGRQRRARGPPRPRGGPAAPPHLRRYRALGQRDHPLLHRRRPPAGRPRVKNRPVAEPARRPRRCGERHS